jgi:hypothetical protein
MAISNDRMIAIGDFIDAHWWATYLCAGIMSFITYYLYCGACSGRLTFTWKEIVAMIAVIVVVRVVSIFDNNISTGIQFASFYFLPAIMGGKMKNSAICYTIHCISQNLSLSIRNLPMYFIKVNSVIAIVAGLESYLWLALMFIIYNYDKEK